MVGEISRFHLSTPFLSEEKAQSCDIAWLQQFHRIMYVFHHGSTCPGVLQTPKNRWKEEGAGNTPRVLHERQPE
jgi:hypothetical protein